VGESASEARAEVQQHSTESSVDPDRPPVLVARGIEVGDRVRGVDLELRAGECVGVTGIDGAGHMQLAEVLTGQRRPAAGEVVVDGAPMRLGSIRAALDAGIGFTPEDRHIAGYVPGLSVAENATLGIIRTLTNRLGLLSPRRRDEAYSRLAVEWSIKAHGPGQAAEELSGGNQQKVVLARSVASDPRALILVNPTAGVDVQAKSSIYATVDELKRRGQSVLVVSSDDGDLEICNRVLVMFEGAVIAELHPPFSETRLAAAVQGDVGATPAAASTAATPSQEGQP
jgi:simple sugar transport system ATP-binding protein